MFRAVLLHPAFNTPTPATAAETADQKTCGCTSSSSSSGAGDGKAECCAGNGRNGNSNGGKCCKSICAETATPADNTTTPACCKETATTTAPAAAATAAVDASAAAAASTAVAGSILVLDAVDFWSATGAADRGRVDIMSQWPWLRQLLLDNTFWPEGVNAIMKWAFPLVIAMLFLGPQVGGGG